jgi:hypothetical protein
MQDRFLDVDLEYHGIVPESFILKNLEILRTVVIIKTGNKISACVPCILLVSNTSR